jgi:hypothetical protein
MPIAFIVQDQTELGVKKKELELVDRLIDRLSTFRLWNRMTHCVSRFYPA